MAVKSGREPSISQKQRDEIRAREKYRASCLATLVEPISERQPEETDRDWGMFLAYANLHPEIRTLEAGWKSFTGRITPPSSFYYATARHFQWAERAKARDGIAGDLLTIDWITRDAQRRASDFALGELILDKVVTAIEAQDPADWSPRATVQFADLAMRLRRDAIPHLRLQQSVLDKIKGSLDGDRYTKIQLLLAEFQK